MTEPDDDTTTGPTEDDPEYREDGDAGDIRDPLDDDDATEPDR